MKIVCTQEQVDKAYDDLDKAIKGLIDAPVIVDKKNYQMLLKQLMILLKKIIR